MKITKKYNSGNEILGLDYESIVIELDSYPENIPSCCYIQKDGVVYDLMYIGDKNFKLLSVDEEYDIGMEAKVLSKGTVIYQYDCSSSKKI